MVFEITMQMRTSLKPFPNIAIQSIFAKISPTLLQPDLLQWVHSSSTARFHCFTAQLLNFLSSSPAQQEGYQRRNLAFPALKNVTKNLMPILTP